MTPLNQISKEEIEMVCTCSDTVPFKDCTLHSCPCGCDMSVADNLYRYYHSDLCDRYTLEEYIHSEKENIKNENNK